MSREDFSDLEADGLAECRQIRSPESSARHGPHGPQALPGDKQASLTTRPPNPSCLSPPILTVITEASRRDLLLDPSEVQRQSPLSALRDSYNNGKKGGHRICLERELSMTSHRKPNSLPWKLEIRMLCSQASLPFSIIRPRSVLGLIE